DPHRSLHSECSERCNKRKHEVMGPVLFFSSRRRHTRFSRDWSSDVCSSDLFGHASLEQRVTERTRELAEANAELVEQIGERMRRSEERRVGKECTAGVMVHAQSNEMNRNKQL